MYKEVYKHLFKNYGQTVGYWVGFTTGLIQFLIVRVYVVVIMAQVASSIAVNDFETAKRDALYYFVAYVVGSIIGFLGELVAIKEENRRYSELSSAFHRKLLGKDMSFFYDHQTGYLASAFRQYLDSNLLLVRFWRGEAMGAIVSMLAPTVVLLFADLRVGLVAAGVVLVQLIYISWSSSKAQQYREASHEVYRKITGEVSDEITNVVAFKSSGVENKAFTIMDNLAVEEANLYLLRRKMNMVFDLPRNIATAAGISAAIYLVVEGIKGSGSTSFGLVVLTLTYMFQIVRNVGALPELISTHDDYVAKIYPNLRYLTDEYESVKDPIKPKKLKIVDGSIALKDVDFGYTSSLQSETKIPVFNTLTLTVAGGEQVGIVGLSGAGKSTLASLLLRFNDVDAGSITIDGIDIREVRQTELRRRIAYVPQEPLLFHRTVRENIAYYNDTATEADIVQAAKAAHAHEFIVALPHGYDTMVGERGVKLSGGQKQRVAIARAVLKKAPIMIFDEATSALDSESEEIIQKALPEILGKQTAIIIAHRLSTIAKLDRIIVMDKGKIIEEGTHQQLLRSQGRYHSLWQRQTRK